MSDQKYRQKGYRDSGSKQEPRRGSGSAPRRPETYGPRPMQPPPSRTISRCAACGAILSASAGGSEACPGCGADLHSCTQCAHFDPGSRFQCSRPIPEAIRDKGARNECELFALRTSVERDVSAAPRSTGSARSDFDALFKKK